MLALAACSTSPAITPASSPSSLPPPSAPQNVTVLPPPPELVEDVVDGRTVVLSNGLKARLLGLAAPGPCWSEASLEFAKNTLVGKPVRYSRASESAITLRLADNSDYAVLAVSKGVARAEKDDPVLTEPEKAATAAGTGLWGSPCKGQDTSPPPPPPPTTTTPPPPPPPPAKKGCSVTYRVVKEWPGGFHAELTVRNHDQTPVNRWALHWRFPSGQKIGDTWGEAAHQYGADVLAMSKDGNGSIAPGGSVSLRFNVSTSGPNVAPTEFSLNWKTCSLE
jgi:hypothetical protein